MSKKSIRSEQNEDLSSPMLKWSCVVDEQIFTEQRIISIGVVGVAVCVKSWFGGITSSLFTVQKMSALPCTKIQGARKKVVIEERA
jgi:hypothetical protein